MINQLLKQRAYLLECIAKLNEASKYSAAISLVSEVRSIDKLLLDLNKQALTITKETDKWVKNTRIIR